MTVKYGFRNKFQFLDDGGGYKVNGAILNTNDESRSCDMEYRY